MVDVKQQPPVRKADSWAHQCDAYNFAWDRFVQQRGSLAGMGMGTGKSKVAVDLIVNARSKRTLIVCPVSVLGVWRGQFDKFSAMDNEVIVLERGTVKRKTEDADAHVRKCEARGVPCTVVANYETIWRPPFVDWANKFVPWDAVVADEVHRAKSHNGKASKALWRIGMQVPLRVGLSGTPMPHSPLDIFGQARFLDDTIFPSSFHRFRDRYARMNRLFPNKVDGWINQDELQEKLARFMFRVESDDVLDLPPAFHDTRRFSLSPGAMRHYKELENEMIVRVRTGEVTPANAMVKLLRLQQMTSGFVGGVDGDSDAIELLGQDKQDTLSDLIEDLPQHEPVVVFCRFRHDLDRTRIVAENLGRKYGELSGRRRDLTPTSTMPDWIDVMGVQIQSGGVGIDLTRAAYCVYYSIGFSLGDYEQSLARLKRPGQTRSVRYYHLVARDTADETVYGALHKRANLVNEVLGYLSKGAKHERSE